MSTISKPSIGLQSLLALRDGGRSPGTLAESVVGVLDLLDFFTLGDVETEGSSAAAALGSVGVITVPNAELWYIKTLTLSATVAAATSLVIAPGASQAVGSLLAPLIEHRSFAAGESLRIASRAPFWIRPGGVLGFHVQALTGANTISVQATLAKYRI